MLTRVSRAAITDGQTFQVWSRNVTEKNHSKSLDRFSLQKYTCTDIWIWKKKEQWSSLSWKFRLYHLDMSLMLTKQIIGKLQWLCWKQRANSKQSVEYTENNKKSSFTWTQSHFCKSNPISEHGLYSLLLIMYFNSCITKLKESLSNFLLKRCVLKSLLKWGGFSYLAI